MTAGYILLAIISAISFITFYTKIKSEEEYVGKCWFFIIAVISVVFYVHFTVLAVKSIKNENFGIGITHNDYKENFYII